MAGLKRNWDKQDQGPCFIETKHLSKQNIETKFETKSAIGLCIILFKFI